MNVIDPWPGNVTGTITTDSTNIENNEQLYANKLDNLDEMKKILQRHKLPKFTQEEIDSFNGLI